MKNLVVVGDSFCSYAPEWPQQLADRLELNLICQGFSGHSWWPARLFLNDIDSSTVEHLIFVHTNATRIPTTNNDLVHFDHSQNPENELQLSVQLYQKYILEPDFLEWAHKQLFVELNSMFDSVIHLHSFPWSIPYAAGTSIAPDLCAISLNEIDAKDMSLFNDTRSNHLSETNNRVLAEQLYDCIVNNKTTLDTSAFELKTTRWFS